MINKLTYQPLFESMVLWPAKLQEINKIVNTIKLNRPRYEKVNALIQNTWPNSTIPWAFIGCVHNMECSLSFSHHLHNGDPLTARTTHVPAGRPVAGHPPFAWEDSAADALILEGMQKVINWDINTILFTLEGYNGYGYQKKGINSPYLWSGSNHYGSAPNIGKYIADGHFDIDAISTQIGAAVLLKQILT